MLNYQRVDEVRCVDSTYFLHSTAFLMVQGTPDQSKGIVAVLANLGRRDTAWAKWTRVSPGYPRSKLVYLQPHQITDISSMLLSFSMIWIEILRETQ